VFIDGGRESRLHGEESYRDSRPDCIVSPATRKEQVDTETSSQVDAQERFDTRSQKGRRKWGSLGKCFVPAARKARRRLCLGSREQRTSIPEKSADLGPIELTVGPTKLANEKSLKTPRVEKGPKKGSEKTSMALQREILVGLKAAIRYTKGGAKGSIS